jgi:hypothetical protein
MWELQWRKFARYGGTYLLGDQPFCSAIGRSQGNMSALKTASLSQFICILSQPFQINVGIGIQIKLTLRDFHIIYSFLFTNLHIQRVIKGKTTHLLMPRNFSYFVVKYTWPMGCRRWTLDHKVSLLTLKYIFHMTPQFVSRHGIKRRQMSLGKKRQLASRHLLLQIACLPSAS